MAPDCAELLADFLGLRQMLLAAGTVGSTPKEMKLAALGSAGSARFKKAGASIVTGVRLSGAHEDYVDGEDGGAEGAFGELAF
eukprot:SAG22_NODE_4657_length_1202_cov_1.230281_2_plen_82_part_01